ncbi:TlpA disulfide reductase family protein [Sphingobacterium sp. BN32]|uniref:TlpA family protein disulfide reductase n=1 Tax=Sphingobacterium sp. BN32 TaxID=3058432 RepID=UPI00265D3472|nr:TlpA disulfide reductase family protein [Sphingobacterium sp. BN32]WKK58383.1 TlpA disulfide reductase family protein [Sphingobacterium sp. BN32]
MKRIFVFWILLIGCVWSGSAIGQSHASISGEIGFGQDGDVVGLYVRNKKTHHLFDTTRLDLDSQLVGKKFNFSIPVGDTPIYVTLDFFVNKYGSERVIIPYIPIERGDTVEIKADEKRKFTFYGKAAAKFRLIDSLNNLPFRSSDPTVIDLERFVKEKLATMERGKQVLLRAKPTLSEKMYKLIEADFIATHLKTIYDNFRNNSFGYAYSDSLGRIGEHIYRTQFYDKPDHIALADFSSYSNAQSAYLLAKNWSDMRFEKRQSRKPTDLFEVLDRRYPDGRIKDEIITDYLYVHSAKFLPIFYPVKAKVTTEYGKRVVNEFERKYILSKNFHQGDIFYDRDGNEVKLDDLKGKVVVMDFWFTGCFPCMAVAKAFPKVEEAFKNRDDIVFLSISTDRDKNKWLKSIQPPDPSQGSPAGSFYVSDKTIYWNTGSGGDDHSFIRKFDTRTGYPRLYVIDKDGNLIDRNPPKPTKNEGKDLIDLLKKALTG